MIKPFDILRMLLFVSAILSLGLLLPDEIALGGEYKIKIPKITDTFDFSKPEYADISDITKKFEKTTKSSKNPKNTTSQAKKEKKTNTKRYVPDSLKINEELRIQYPKGKEKVLYHFFSQLKRLESGKEELIRVVHFGDSQLEGDRITAFLREKFQAVFGGCGVGIATLVDKLNSKSSIVQNTPTNWIQTYMYGPKYRNANPKYYGILGEIYKIPVPEEPTWTKATLNYIKSPYASPIQQKVENIKVLYRAPEAPFEITINAPGQAEVKTKIEESKEFAVYEHKLTASFERVQIDIATGSASPEIYGVMLDCKKGITFDNVPLRGSSGVDFVRADAKHFKQQFEELNVKFIILQFGVNLVPSPQANYGWYENMFYQQLKFLKDLDPQLDILVVGVSDMSYNTGNGYESYPNIEKIRDAQRNAAFKAGCAFWDLYEAMGGHNSMPSWVFAQPQALANKDFTHFTAKGAGIVSEMLYKAILSEYDDFNALLN
jgi:lysophospholipase L1-like esterase